MACSNRPSVSTRICRFLPSISLPASNPCESMRAPFFGAFHALTIDDAGGGAGVSFCLLAAFHVECVMNAIQHAVALPPNEVVMDCAARWKILRKVASLAASAQDVHHAVHHSPHVCSPLAAAALRCWNERFDKRPLVIRQVARVSQVIAIVFRSVLFVSTSAVPPRPPEPVDF
jgi:hypothetical protein